MRHKIAFLVLGIGLAIGGAARADVVAHNGNYYSNPAPAESLRGVFGPDEVDVELSWAKPYLQYVDKFYNEMATLQLEYVFESGQPPMSSTEAVVNDTDVTWSSFIIDLHFAQYFYGDEEPLPEGDLPIDIVATMASLNVASITHTSFTDGAELELTFTDGGLAPGGDFSLSYNIMYLLGTFPEWPTDPGFAMEETPVMIIPAPGAAILAVVGLGCIGWVKRRCP